MSTQLTRTKSNHMIEYYRKQSDKKMVTSIVNMKSELEGNFSLEKYSVHNKLNKSKREMLERLKRENIHLQNKKMVYRIKKVVEQTTKGFSKYLDNSTCERLILTRNQFRKRSKIERMNKMGSENQKLLKRLLNAKSSYVLSASDASISRDKSQKKINPKKSSFRQPNMYILAAQTELQASLNNIQKELQIYQKRQMGKKRQNVKKRSKTSLGQNSFTLEKIYQVQRNRYLPKKNTLFARQSYTQNEEDSQNKQQESLYKKTKIPLKGKQIKLELISNREIKTRKNPEYAKNFNKTIENRNSFNKECQQTYRIYV